MIGLGYRIIIIPTRGKVYADCFYIIFKYTSLFL